MDSIWDIRSIFQWSVRDLKERGFETARLDIELLLSSVLNCSRVELYTQFDKPVSKDERERFKLLLARRRNGEPVAYLLGCREFYGRSFQVNPSVLIPRPETELLIDLIIKIYRGSETPHAILDIGTGSGVLAITLALSFPEAKIYGWDISPEALIVAGANANVHGCAQRILFSGTDALLAKSYQPGESLDLIVSNPPYIDRSDNRIERNVAQYEPAFALYAGDNGLEFYKAIIPNAAKALNRSGVLAVECGAGQDREICALMKAEGFEPRTEADLSGIARVVWGRLNATE